MSKAKRKPSKRKVDVIYTSWGNGVQKWFKVGTLPKVTTFKFNSKRSPADSLHARIKKLAPDINSISDVACSRRTNEYLRRELTKYARKHTYYRGRKLETAVAFTMLDMSPCDLEGAEDFILYLRVDDTSGEPEAELMGK